MCLVSSKARGRKPLHQSTFPGALLCGGLFMRWIVHFFFSFLFFSSCSFFFMSNSSSHPNSHHSPSTTSTPPASSPVASNVSPSTLRQLGEAFVRAGNDYLRLLNPFPSSSSSSQQPTQLLLQLLNSLQTSPLPYSLPQASKADTLSQFISRNVYSCH